MHILILSHLCFSTTTSSPHGHQMLHVFLELSTNSLCLSGENAVQVASNKSAISFRSQHHELLCYGSTAAAEDRDNLPFLTTMPVVIPTPAFPSITFMQCEKITQSYCYCEEPLDYLSLSVMNSEITRSKLLN